MEKLNKKPVEALEKQIAEVEKKIKVLIKEADADDSIRHLFDLVTSVDGVDEAAAAAVVFCEPGRRAIENETFNTLKNQGYNRVGGPI